MTELKIDKGIPLPPKVEPPPQKKSVLQQTLEMMEIGDSIFMEDISPVVSCMTQYLGLHIEIRKVEGGMRLWRVEDPALKLVPEKS